jgi:hypothetical protein
MRLTNNRQYEEVEIELPLAVYNSMQASSATTTSRAALRSAALAREPDRHGLLKKVCRIFSRWG